MILINISHEIRTPVHGFANLADGLVSHWKKLSEEQRLEIANKISDNSIRLSELVFNLLDLSKYTSGKWLLEKKSFNLTTLLDNIVSESNDLYLFNSTLKIVKKYNSQHLSIEADEQKIGQVLRNLIANAIKFSDKESKKIELFCHVEKEDGRVFLSVKDEGIGVPEDEIEEIFSPFTQSSRTNDKSGGVGLGLVICKEIIDAHQGEIYAENNKKKGAEMRFYLPLTPMSNATMDIDEKSVVTDIANSGTNDEIVIIDDEISILDSLELMLMSS